MKKITPILLMLVLGLAVAAAPKAKLITETFDVIAGFEERVMEARVAYAKEDFVEQDAEGRVSVQDWSALFTGYGVSWPEGSLVRYTRGIGRLVVRNTPENMKLIKELLTILNVQPRQIEVEIQFVEFNRKDIEAQSIEGPITKQQLMALRKAGKSSLLAAPRVTTQAGCEATVKGVVEYIYPTEFDAESVTRIRGEKTNHVSSIGTGPCIEPGAFETRQVGELLTVLADISPEGKIITLSLMPEVVFPPIWKDFGGSVTDAKGRVTTYPAEVPFFRTLTVQTQVQMKNGATVLASGSGGSPREDQIVYTFICARLVGMDGNPL